MHEINIDADVLVRLLTKDDPTKQEHSAQLFEAVERGEIALTTPLTTIADVVFVLSSPRLYHLPRTEVAVLLVPLLKWPRLKIKNRRLVLSALELFGQTTLDFGDAMIVTAMHRSQTSQVYSYDQDFDGIEGITRLEPPLGPIAEPVVP
jgi:predicted nucleic acid-binding protein